MHRPLKPLTGNIFTSILYILIFGPACSPVETPDTDDILNTFSIAEGFKIELVAMEPLISDPVAMEIDEHGDVYVVEMHGYPLNVNGTGLVKKLYDDDQDGIFDQSVVFADSLILPTGIMRWKQGVLVTDPPDLLYLEDTDGDGRADKREALVTGFALSNPQHNFNSPVYGLDNWIYLANEGTYDSKAFGDLFGDQGDEIYFPGKPDAPRLPKNALDRNVKVDLNKFQLHMLSGDSQYGHTFDQWGHHFGTENWSHIYHEVLNASYIERNPQLELATAMQYVPDYGIGFEIYPITQNPQHQLLTDVGAITSSCGITWYLGGAFPEPFDQVIFIAEPTHNLIHTDLLYDKGATFGSSKQFTGREFLASTDGRFRPVNLYIGPDGSLYLLDYHRKIIEHPEWMSEEVLNSGDLYEGTDQGRIFRITATETGNIKSNGNRNSKSPLLVANLGQASAEQLVRYLQHPNIWWRRQAQRLIVDAGDHDIIPLLKEFIGSANELGVLHGLWTVDGLGDFDKDLVLWALEHSSAGVRENAIKIAELHREKIPELENQLISMKNDSHSKVRFQLLCTLGYYSSEEAAQARRDLLFHDIDDPWMQLAALSAKQVNALSLFVETVNKLDAEQSAGAQSLIVNLGKSIGKSGESQQVKQVISKVTSDSNPKQSWWRVAVMKGLAETVPEGMINQFSKGEIGALTSLFKETTDSQLRSASLDLLKATGYFRGQNSLIKLAAGVAEDPELDETYRRDAITIMAWSVADENSRLFQHLILNESSSKIRNGAIEALRYTSSTQETEFLLDQWKNLSPAERDLAVSVFGSSEERQLQFLQAVQAGQIQASVLGWGRTVRLLNSNNQQVRGLARQVLEGNETISDSVWQEYQLVLTLTGDALEGKQVFDRSCAICHQISGKSGTNYGPDLAAVKNRAKSGIMIDILKPNRSISDGYDLWTIEKESGEIHSGIITGENINTLTLRNAAGEEILIQRQVIKSRLASEISAMPEGLHGQISPQEMADLLEYLKN